MILYELISIYNKHFLFENRVEFVKNNFRKQLTKRLALDGITDKTPDEVVDYIAQHDPSPAKKKAFVQPMTQLYLKGKVPYDDIPRFTEPLKLFPKMKGHLEKTDLTKYDSIEELEDAVIEKSFTDKKLSDGQRAARTKKRGKEGGKLMASDDDSVIMKLLTPEGACYYGKGMNICTSPNTTDNQFDYYNKDGVLHIVMDKNTKAKYQLFLSNSEREDQYMDKNNSAMSLRELKNKYDSVHELLSMDFKDPKTALANIMRVKKDAYPPAEPLLATDADASAGYAENVLDGPFPAGEKAIATNPSKSFDYARLLTYKQLPVPDSIADAILTSPDQAVKLAILLKGNNMPISDKIVKSILKKSWSAYQYAKEILRDRFPEGEQIIATDPMNSFNYLGLLVETGSDISSEIMKGIAKSPEYSFKFAQQYGIDLSKEMLDTILTSPSYLWKYAKLLKEADKDIPKKLISEIAKHSVSAYNYAMQILEGPFPEGEKAIATNPHYAYQYAAHIAKTDAIITGISKSPEYAYKYARDRLRAPFPEGEKAIATSPNYSYLYADRFSRPFPAGEKAIATSSEHAYQYADQILNGQFPAGENAIATSPEYSYLYTKILWRDGLDFPEGRKAIASDTRESFNYAYTIERFYPDKEIPSDIIKSIASDPMSSYQYASDVIRRPFPEGETAIASDTEYATKYAQNVLDFTRFYEGEKQIIWHSPKSALHYANRILEKRYTKPDFPDADKIEDFILTGDDYTVNEYIYLINDTPVVNDSKEARQLEADKFQNRKYRLNAAATASTAYAYAMKHKDERHPDLEKVIATSPEYALKYATDVIRGKWPEGEKAILTSPNFTRTYIEDALNKNNTGEFIRWPEGETVIATSSLESMLYAIINLDERFLEGEPTIMADVNYADGYESVMKGKEKEKEEAKQKQVPTEPKQVSPEPEHDPELDHVNDQDIEEPYEPDLDDLADLDDNTSELNEL